jgi:hypothetical protein
MNTAKLITKAYFIGALSISFTHIITSAEKMGGEGYEPYVAPFMVDGVALLGMHMRNEKYDDRTNKIGLWAQATAGLLSLAMNVHAAHSLFGLLLGIAVVVLFLATEWMAGNIRLRTDSEAEKKAAAERAAIAEAEAIAAAASAWMAACAHPTKCQTAERCASKTAAAAKAKKTRKATARTRKIQAEALEALVEPGVRVLKAV